MGWNPIAFFRRKMTKEELLEALTKIIERQDIQHCDGHYYCDEDHENADRLLLKYIDDERITEAFNEIEKWYS